MTGLFSESYGYVKTADVLIIGRLTPEITNSICTCYDILKDSLYKGGSSTFGTGSWRLICGCSSYITGRMSLQTRGNAETVATENIQKNDVEWYRNLDMKLLWKNTNLAYRIKMPRGRRIRKG